MAAAETRVKEVRVSRCDVLRLSSSSCGRVWVWPRAARRKLRLSETRGSEGGAGVGGGKSSTMGGNGEIWGSTGVGLVAGGPACWHPGPARQGTGIAPAPTQNGSSSSTPRPPWATSSCSQPARHARFTHVLVLVLFVLTRATSSRLKHMNWPIFQLFMAERAQGKFYFSRVGGPRAPDRRTPPRATVNHGFRLRHWASAVLDMDSSHAGFVLWATASPSGMASFGGSFFVSQLHAGVVDIGTCAP